MTETDSTEALTGLLEQVARRLHSNGYAAHLFPAQWSALRYIHQAEADRRTAIDLARHQGLASGAVARTVRTLIEKGLVTKMGTIGRGRAERLELTEKGSQLLKRDPLASIRKALEDLSTYERSVLAKGLETAIDATRTATGRV
ncbi:MarR family transcriptional regulator [Aurantimonas sp. 22II-16-19i]|uniref:MarR family winged helix-turn-helix transcriptional regulator n=1 Tax=Aurantimonas sp. 22II-16-19i TaxID=1317114 RepID=UPI0009F7A5B1|nr:MarR family transcriptional regulator [Aurantimonas sp. 22II-16-19i]MAU97532.1 transcriptional regulator [Fulvimarina sp.]ORE97380.1 transcriptional regulator [Aurantimonas sp. 22II-16-19i]